MEHLTFQSMSRFSFNYIKYLHICDFAIKPKFTANIKQDYVLGGILISSK